MEGFRRKKGGKAGFENLYCGPSDPAQNIKKKHFCMLAGSLDVGKGSKQEVTPSGF